MLLLFPSWLFWLVGIMLVGLLCAILSIFATRWMKKRNIAGKRMENFIAFLIVIVVVAAAMFIKENMFTSVYKGSLIVTSDEIVEVHEESAEFLSLQEAMVIDYLFTQMNYGEEFPLNEKENVRVSVVIEDYRSLMPYMKIYEQEKIVGNIKHYFPFDVYFEREHFEEIEEIIAEMSTPLQCEEIVPSLSERLSTIETVDFHYEIRCVS